MHNYAWLCMIMYFTFFHERGPCKIWGAVRHVTGCRIAMRIYLVLKISSIFQNITNNIFVLKNVENQVLSYKKCYVGACATNVFREFPFIPHQFWAQAWIYIKIPYSYYLMGCYISLLPFCSLESRSLAMLKVLGCSLGYLLCCSAFC